MHLKLAVIGLLLIITCPQIEALSQEARLSPFFCDYREPMSIFDTSITGLADLYEYLLPDESSADDQTELNLRKSEVSLIQLIAKLTN